MDFPMVFDKCPLCHHLGHVVGEIAKELKAKGTLSKEILFGYHNYTVLLFDPRTPPVFTADTLLVIEDICQKCGHVYVVYVSRQQVPVTAKIAPGDQGGKPGWGKK